MTKRHWGPAWRTNADGKIQQVRAPTEDELLKLELELDAWHEAHPDVMPPQLWQKILELIWWQGRQCPCSREQIRRMRWSMVDLALRRGHVIKGADERFRLLDSLGIEQVRLMRWHAERQPPMSLTQAYRYAEKLLWGSPAQAEPDMIARDYREVERRRGISGGEVPNRKPNKR